MAPVNQLSLPYPIPTLLLPTPPPPRYVCPYVHPPSVHIVINNALMVTIPPPPLQLLRRVRWTHGLFLLQIEKVIRGAGGESIQNPSCFLKLTYIYMNLTEKPVTLR